MLLYLVQHGQANPESLDPERNLSEQGILDVNSIGSFAAKLYTPLEHIWHSGKARAAETPSLLAGYLTDGRAVEKTEGLLPNDDPHQWRPRLQSLDANVMLVGHL